MNNELAPICLFTYNRPDKTKQTIEALKNNFLAAESELFIFSDGPKDEFDKLKIIDVRRYLESITGFKKITLIKSQDNKGLANSIISGVSEIIQRYGKVIVLEDDLITSPNFLDFMNQGLSFYKNDRKIHSISGYTMDLPSLKNYPKDYYLSYRASSWGWATWLDRWENVDWNASEYSSFKFKVGMQIKFMRGGSDMPRMLKRKINNKNDSWAILWCFDQFIKNQYAIFPTKSKIKNIGYGDAATHTKNIERFITEMDISEKREFNFGDNDFIDSSLVREFRRKFSFINRLKGKLIKK